MLCLTTVIPVKTGIQETEKAFFEKE